MSSSSGPGTKLLSVRRQSCCVVCGPDHPRGLRIHFETAADGAAVAEWTPAPDWEGYEGIVHGGIVSTVLDEAMSKAVAAQQGYALTGELTVRFRRYVESGRKYLLRGWIVERNKRLLRTEATLTTTAGDECAHARASFVVLPKGRGPGGGDGLSRGDSAPDAG